MSEQGEDTRPTRRPTPPRIRKGRRAARSAFTDVEFEDGDMTPEDVLGPRPRIGDWIERIAIVLLTLIVLLAIAAGIYWWFELREPAEPAQAEPAPQEPVPEETAPPEEPGPYYAVVPDVTVPLFTDGRINQQVSIRIRLHVTEAELVDALSTRRRQAADRILASLFDWLPDQGLRPDGTVDLPAVKERLLREMQDLFGEQRVYDVLIPAVDHRDLNRVR